MPTPSKPSNAAAKTKNVNGKIVSAKSKTGDSACSSAMSTWVTTRKAGTTPASVFAVLGQCRAKARAMKQATAQRNAGNEGKAQRLDAIARGDKGPITFKERMLAAQTLRGKRAEMAGRKTDIKEQKWHLERGTPGGRNQLSPRQRTEQVAFQSQRIKDNKSEAAVIRGKATPLKAKATAGPVAAKASVSPQSARYDRLLANRGQQSSASTPDLVAKVKQKRDDKASTIKADRARGVARQKDAVASLATGEGNPYTVLYAMRRKHGDTITSQADMQVGRAKIRKGERVSVVSATMEGKTPLVEIQTKSGARKHIPLDNAKQYFAWPGKSGMTASPVAQSPAKAAGRGTPERMAKAQEMRFVRDNYAKLDRASRGKEGVRIGGEDDLRPGVKKAAMSGIQRGYRRDDADRLTRLDELKSQRAARQSAAPAPTAVAAATLREQAAAFRATKGTPKDRAKALRNKLESSAESRIKSVRSNSFTRSGVAIDRKVGQILESKQRADRRLDRVIDANTSKVDAIAAKRQMQRDRENELSIAQDRAVAAFKAKPMLKSVDAQMKREDAFIASRSAAPPKPSSVPAVRTPSLREQADAARSAKGDTRERARKLAVLSQKRYQKARTAQLRAEKSGNRDVMAKKGVAYRANFDRHDRMSVLAGFKQWKTPKNMIDVKYEVIQSPPKPSLREQADAARAAKGDTRERIARAKAVKSAHAADVQTIRKTVRTSAPITGSFVKDKPTLYFGGNTFANKDAIKSLGAKWDGGSKEWVGTVSGTMKERGGVVEKLNALSHKGVDITYDRIVTETKRNRGKGVKSRVAAILAARS